MAFGYRLSTFTPLILTAILANPLSAIIVDGDPADWLSDATRIADEADDGIFPGADLRSVSITNDAFNLYLLVEFGTPVNLRNADLRLFIDGDNDPLTGTALNNRGMDFSWDFDRNRGTSTLTSRREIGRGNLIHRMAPDASANFHEIAVSLEALPAARTGEPIHLRLIEENSRDVVPEDGDWMMHIPQGPLAVQPMPIDTRRSGRALRVMSWNVLRDAPFEGNNGEPFRRILTAVQPDIILFQEIYETPVEEILDLMRQYLQLSPSQEWTAVRNFDCITVSRYPVEGSWQVDGNLVSRHTTEAVLGHKLLIANTHLPCCNSGEDGRVRESANLLTLLEARLNEPTDAPQSLVIGGDLNSGGLAPELIDLTSVLLPLEMASPRHVYQYDQYTWGSLGSSFGSSKLDFFLFDPGTLLRHKAYTLDTDLLPPAALEELGLLAADTFVSDHLPLVVDFRSRTLPTVLEATLMAPNGECVSTWWGPLNGYHFPFIRHERLGWLQLELTAKGLWFANEEGTWSWTGPEVYPWFYSASRQEWQYDHLGRF